MERDKTIKMYNTLIEFLYAFENKAYNNQIDEKQEIKEFLKSGRKCLNYLDNLL